MKAALSLILLVAVAVAPLAQAPSDGEISGRIADRANGNLPGVQMTVIGSGERREVFTDVNGEFRVGALRPGAYEVRATLPGFTALSGTVTLTPSVRHSHVSWAMEVGCVEFHEGVRPPLRTVVPNARAIVHVRLRSESMATLVSTRPNCNEHLLHAYSVDVVRTEPLLGRAVVERVSPAIVMSSAALTPGGEYLLLVSNPGRVVGGRMLPIMDGRVTALEEEPLGGMPVDEAIKTLVEWSRPPAPSR